MRESSIYCWRAKDSAIGIERVQDLTGIHHFSFRTANIVLTYHESVHIPDPSGVNAINLGFIIEHMTGRMCNHLKTD